MSRVIKYVSFGEFGPGDLHMLLLRLEERIWLINIMYTHLLSITDPQYVSCLGFWLLIPQRPPFQCAVIDHIGSLQDRVRRRGQTHAGGGWDSQAGPW